MLMIHWRVRRTRRPWFTTRMSNLDSSDHRRLFHLETVHFKWASVHRTRRRFWTMFTYGFIFAWKSFSWHLLMARWIVFTDSGFWKYSWAHLVMSVTESCRWVMQCHLRAEDHRHPAKVFGLVPYAEISTVSLNILIMLCTVEDEICKAFAIWHWGTLSFYTLFHRLKSLCPSLFWETLPL